MKNQYVFAKTSETEIRCIWFETDSTGCKAVANVIDASHNGTKDDMKYTIKALYEMMFVGAQDFDIELGYTVQAAGHAYDESLAGKARKQSSKDINVLTEQLWG